MHTSTNTHTHMHAGRLGRKFEEGAAPFRPCAKRKKTNTQEDPGASRGPDTGINSPNFLGWAKAYRYQKPRSGEKP